jgi:hypothetical protein
LVLCEKGEGIRADRLGIQRRILYAAARTYMGSDFFHMLILMEIRRTPIAD